MIIDNGEAFIKRNARMMWRKTANSREEMPEYVERSYHEALINALVHRDYLVNGSEVHIDIYDDRMEIYSPGGNAGWFGDSGERSAHGSVHPQKSGSCGCL